LFQQCRNYAEKPFEKAQQIENIVKLITGSEKFSGFIFLIRVNRCNVCTDSAIVSLQKLPSQSNTIVLTDGYEKNINNYCIKKGFKLNILEEHYLQKHGADLSENYLFVFDSGEIETYFNAKNPNIIWAYFN